MTDTIDYGNLMHNAMRGLIQKVLTSVQTDGLPGEHHFFITFDTGHPDVEIADWLSDRYPEEMTVVMQHWFDDLEVDDNGFSLTLKFGGTPQSLYIPYDAILTFVDPSVEFGLRFETQFSEDEDEAEEEDQASSEATLPETPDAPPQGDAEVVSLDSFRK